MNAKEQKFQPTPEQIDKFIEECDNGEWEEQSYADFKYELAKDFIAAYEQERRYRAQ